MQNVKKDLDTIFQDVFNVSSKVFDYSKESIPNWDSLGHITLISEIENKFGLLLDTEDILNLNSFADAEMIILKNLSENLERG